MAVQVPQQAGSPGPSASRPATCMAGGRQDHCTHMAEPSHPKVLKEPLAVAMTIATGICHGCAKGTAGMQP